MLQNNEQKSTIAEKPKIAWRMAFYISVSVLLVLLVLSVFFNMKWGFLIGIFMVGPIILLANMMRKMTGVCPHCGMQVSDVPENGGLTCSACKSRIVVRDGMFWELTNGSNEINGSSLPPGMTLQEFTDRKQKIKRYAIIASILYGMILPVIFLVGSFWGMFEAKETHTMEELKIAEGTYCVRTRYSKGATYYKTDIKDRKTGEVILTASDGFCQIDASRWNFQNKPVRVWYNAYDGPGRGKMVYQLEVDGLKICTLDQVNSRIIENEKRMKIIRPLMFFGLLFFNGCIAVVIGYYGVYRRRINRLFGKEN